MPDRFRDLADLRIAYSTSDRPLRTFYIPVLARAVRLDRMAGYFTSHGLAYYARGLSGFVKGGGRMRMVVGAKLAPEDVEAIESGSGLTDVTRRRLLHLFEAPTGSVEVRRLEMLAWMVATGTLEIRVGLARDARTGHPLASPEADGYFHAKSGVATDAHGGKIGWSGSNNDTAAALSANYEQFMVHRSWTGGQPHIEWIEARFARLWENRDPDWITIPIPEAVERRLLEYTPPEAPGGEPLEEAERDAREAEQVVAAWLRDAPHLIEVGSRLGRATANIRPWPHQHRVVEDVVAGFPDRFLLADEVGLGKTIEVGLALRDLTLSGMVERCLILTPRSVLNQWRDELREKFLLTAVEYQSPASFGTGSPVLASSQLAKRKERRGEFLSGPDWDLVVIDEAHHARRKGFIDPRRRPNRLLELLEGVDGLPGLADKTRGLLLLTATPMQINPVEVWDLLLQLGMPGRWGASGSYFVRYFEALRQASEDWATADWELVAAMAGDEVEQGGDPFPQVADPLRDQIGWSGWAELYNLVTRRDGPGIRKLRDPVERAAALAVLRHLTPLRRRMCRFTRRTLRDYRDRGLLPGRLAERRPEPRWIEMATAERELYDRIEEYIAEFYNKYENERTGLGFVMTVYRRRLTSSFHALHRSLERRLAFLQGRSKREWLTDEDTEEDDLQDDVQEVFEGTSGEARSLYEEEIEYVETFLSDLSKLGRDTKYDRLVDDLDELFSRRDSVVIFTQYTDTMDYLREGLRHVYGSRIACYSGRGGERWNGQEWEQVGKERIKQDFARRDIAVLLGTDAMAEGLNLQTCGVEINYDVPWNPMRLEQRIGRLDRIGQDFDEVWIWSYFLEGTIEAEVYRRLMDRIDWFTGVVGPVQPILHRVGQAVKTLALTPRAERGARLNHELRSIETALDTAEREGFSFDPYLTGFDTPTVPRPPVTDVELEKFMVGSYTIGHRFRPEANRPGAYRLDGRRVTFRADVADQYPESVRLLTYGDPLFAELLGRFPEPADGGFGIARAEAVDVSPPQAGWYRATDRGLTAIDTMGDLEKALRSPTRHPGLGAEANGAFLSYLENRRDRKQQADRRRARERRSALRETGYRILREATYVWLARRENMFGGDGIPMTGQALTSMARTEGYPFAPLARLVGGNVVLSGNDPDWLDARGRTTPFLDGRMQHLRNQAAKLVGPLHAASPRPIHRTTEIKTKVTVL